MTYSPLRTPTAHKVIGKWWVGIRLLLDIRDIWVGVYWKQLRDNGGTEIYICIIPCLPINVSVLKVRQ